MKKNILYLLSFIAMVGLVIYLLQCSIDYCYKKRVHNKFSKIFQHQLDDNIMIFGSSTAFHHFDPQIINNITGYSTCNMGMDATFFVQYSAFIKEYLTYKKKCNYIVIACDFGNLEVKKLITRPDLYYAYLNNNYVYKSLHQIEPSKIWRARYIPGYKLTLLTKLFYNSILFNSDKKDDLGYCPVLSNWDQADTFKPFLCGYDENIFSDFKQTADLIVKNNIKLIIVMTPIFEKGYKLIRNAEFIKSQYRSLVSGNVYFMDYTNDSLFQKREYFYNNSHLNLMGATIFSNKFSYDLLKIINSDKGKIQ